MQTALAAGFLHDAKGRLKSFQTAFLSQKRHQIHIKLSSAPFKLALFCRCIID
jgi:hypothetical protein